MVLICSSYVNMFSLSKKNNGGVQSYLSATELSLVSFSIARNLPFTTVDVATLIFLNILDHFKWLW